MGKITLTRASEMIHVTDTLESLGVSAERMLGQANLPMWHYADPDDLIPTHHIFELLDRAARSLGIQNFGLQVGTKTSLSTLGSLGAVAASAVTVHHALLIGCRLIRLHNSGSRLFLVEANDEVWFCHSEFPMPKVGRRQKEQYVLMRLIDGVRMGAGPGWRPAKICLQTHEPPNRALREALGDPEIRIGQRVTAFAIPRALLPQPLRQKAASRDAARAAEQRLWQTAPATDFPEALGQIAGTLLAQAGHAKVETMAEITGLTVRTLQRRLAKHGLNYLQIVDQARYQAATRLLENSDIRITEVAMDLGYADSAHFTRAFKRWAGITPSAYRRHHLLA